MRFIIIGGLAFTISWAAFTTPMAYAAPGKVTKATVETSVTGFVDALNSLNVKNALSMLTTGDRMTIRGETDVLGLISGNKMLNPKVKSFEAIKEGKAFANQDVTVDNQGCQFTPRITVAHKGDMLAATNSDAVLHNMHTVLKKKNKRKELDNLPLNKGVVIKKKLKRTGQVDVKCDAHEWMQGSVWVFSHPYNALTDANGSFSLTDVPPGDYTLKVWHEKLGTQTNKVSVKAGAAATQDVTFK